jgi:hypothetical protein
MTKELQVIVDKIVFPVSVDIDGVSLVDANGGTIEALESLSINETAEILAFALNRLNEMGDVILAIEESIKGAEALEEHFLKEENNPRLRHFHRGKASAYGSVLKWIKNASLKENHVPDSGKETKKEDADPLTKADNTLHEMIHYLGESHCNETIIKLLESAHCLIHEVASNQSKNKEVEELCSIGLLFDGINWLVKAEATRFDDKGKPVLWAVRRSGGSALSKITGEFDYEPLPSNRDEEYLQEHRFDTLAEAKQSFSITRK